MFYRIKCGILRPYEKEADNFSWSDRVRLPGPAGIFLRLHRTGGGFRFLKLLPPDLRGRLHHPDPYPHPPFPPPGQVIEIEEETRAGRRRSAGDGGKILLAISALPQPWLSSGCAVTSVIPEAVY